MCGLVYAHNFKGKAVNNEVLQQFDKQRARGTQGFGLFDGIRHQLVRATSEDKILKWLVNYDSSLIMFHHRMPSSTINTKRAAHPFRTKKYFGDSEYILIHNGWLYNALDLKEAHEQLAIRYQSNLSDGTFNDSEALLWDIALTIEGRQSAITAAGAIAFICLKLVKGTVDRLYFGRNYSKPLHLIKASEGIGLSSEGMGDDVLPHFLHCYNYQTKRFSKRSLTFPATEAYEFSPSPAWNDDIDEYTGGVYRDDDFSAEQLTWFGNRRAQYAAADPVESTLFTPDEILAAMEDYYPEQSLIDAKVRSHLLAHNGNYHEAWQALETELIAGEHYALTLGDYQRLRLLELAMLAIECDEAFETKLSVHPAWQAKTTTAPLQWPNPVKVTKALDIVRQN